MKIKAIHKNQNGILVRKEFEAEFELDPTFDDNELKDVLSRQAGEALPKDGIKLEKYGKIAACSSRRFDISSPNFSYRIVVIRPAANYDQNEETTPAKKTKLDEVLEQIKSLQRQLNAKSKQHNCIKCSI